MTQTIMAAAEAADCSKSQLISLPQMHERSHITISARSVTVNVQRVDENMKPLDIYVNIWHFVNIQKLINCADKCVCRLCLAYVVTLRAVHLATLQVRQYVWHFNIEISLPCQF